MIHDRIYNTIWFNPLNDLQYDFDFQNNKYRCRIEL